MEKAAADQKDAAEKLAQTTAELAVAEATLAEADAAIKAARPGWQAEVSAWADAVQQEYLNNPEGKKLYDWLCDVQEVDAEDMFETLAAANQRILENLGIQVEGL